MEELILLAALLLFGYGLISRRTSYWPVSGPMIFVMAGVLVSPLGFGLVDLNMDSEAVRVIAEITLVLILFCDASALDLKALRREYRIPARLLGVGLPLTMALGAVVALWLFTGNSPWVLVAIAFILSPTDAALSQAVVANKKSPQLARDSVDVESGLNDGIVLAPIMACIAVIGAQGESLDASQWLFFALKQVVFGPIAGAAIGYAGGWLIEQAARKEWISFTFERLSSIALAVLCYSFAEVLGGNGFIAAFFGGLFLSTHSKRIRERMQDFGEAEGQQLSLLVFLIFGVAIIPVAFEHWSWRTWLYAGLSLTVIRMGPVILSLIRSGLDWPTRFFIAWFGPRGIASVLYLVIFISELGLEKHRELLSIIVLTVSFSIVLHGVSAVPLTNMYAKYSNRRSS